jgi:hypothetical protein
MRSAIVSRFPTFRFSCLITLPPLMLRIGVSPSRGAKCLSVAKALKSGPTSVYTACAIMMFTPSMVRRSTPNNRVNSDPMSKAGAFFGGFFCFLSFVAAYGASSAAAPLLPRRGGDLCDGDTK